MKRVLCIRLPSWPIQRLVVARPALKGRMIILHRRDPRRGQCVVACSRVAYCDGVRPGMSMTEATSLQQRAATDRAALYIAPHDTQADWEALDQLACWCERFGPIVGFEHRESLSGPARSACSPDCLYLDATNLASHYGGARHLARFVAQSLDERGYHVRVALADTLGAAWACATFATSDAEPLALSEDALPGDHQAARSTNGSTFHVIASEATFAALRSLPVQALRLPLDTISLLEQLGIFQIGQLAQLPRASLSSRFGHTLLKRWDQAMGLVKEVLIAHHPLPQFQADWSLEHPTSRHGTIQLILDTLVERCVKALAQRGEGVIELTCRFTCTRSAETSRVDRQLEQAASDCDTQGRETLSLRIGLFQPTASVEHLVQLLQMQREQLALPGLVEHIAVQALITAPLERHQRELFPGATRHTPRHLAHLVDRLSSRLGRDGVVRPRLLADAQPESAYCYLPLTGHRDATVRPRRPASNTSSQSRQFARPLYLHSPPLPLDVVAVAPDGPPSRLHFSKCQHRVSRYWGPERIETGWWRGRSVRRDYYRVETDAGHWLWLFRQLGDGKWFLHGMFG